jgi:benzoyl-CoA reductase subunit D
MTQPRHLTAGIDAGSSSIKVAICRSTAGDHAELLTTVVQRIRRRNPADVAEAAFREGCEKLGLQTQDFDYVASTGDGDAVGFHTGHFYSMTSHARGALFLEPQARAVLDSGALHARALRIDDRGKVLGHKMTGQCASGSGQFVENISRYLGVPLEDVGALSRTAQTPEQVSSICAVLAETDVINMVSRGISTADILKGIHLSIAGRLARLIRGVGSEEVVLLTGGLSCDEGLVAALRETLAEGKGAHLDVRNHPQSILAGAIGAALLGAYRCEQLERKGRLELLAAGRARAA